MEGTFRRRRGRARRSVLALVLAFVLSTGLACGGGEESRSYSDEEITKALSLEDVQGTLAVNGDIFCEVKPSLLNDGDEVSEALDRKEGLVLTSVQGNVGIQVVPPFAPDCETKVRRLLNDLDPTERQERREGKGDKGDAGGSGGGESSDSESS
ncbi:hypothetical protein HJD18_12950 [Thermoleophilia bacterium SCSIO 60948]|nr:hypothetical protein HJD18_12950 [Thermoleophilia bacterium SCSIO 60948]